MIGPAANGRFHGNGARGDGYGARYRGDPRRFSANTIGPLYAPERGLTIATGVAQMNDQVSTGLNVLQANPARQPAVSNINGIQALLYDGVDDLLTLGGVATATTHCFCIVLRRESAGAAADQFPYLDSNAGMKARGVATNWQQSNGVASGSDLAVGTAYVLAINLRGNADRDFWTNGLLNHDVTNSPPADVAAISLGAHPAGGNLTNCTIGDVVRFNTPLTTSALYRVMKSFAAKFKIGLSI